MLQQLQTFLIILQTFHLHSIQFLQIPFLLLNNFKHLLFSSFFHNSSFLHNSSLSLPQHQGLPHPMTSLFFPTLCILSCLPFSRIPEGGEERHENCLCPTSVAQDWLHRRPSLTSAIAFYGRLSSGRDSNYISLKFSENYKHLKFPIFFS